MKDRATIRGSWDCNDPAWSDPETDEEWDAFWEERVRREEEEAYDRWRFQSETRAPDEARTPNQNW